MNSASLEHKPIRREGAEEPGTVWGRALAGPRVLLFTDTLGDVNGVSRFINDIADRARETGRSLEVFTSTRFAVRDVSNLHNFKPRLAVKMPGYADLEIALPPIGEMLRAARAFKPNFIHISTPGPVGLVGRIAARQLGVPLIGVYHTDFPAYIDKLFDDEVLSWLGRTAMRRFYKPFRTIFTRSRDYANSLGHLGIPRRCCVPLKPGMQTDYFSPRFRNEDIWAKHGVPAASVKILYVGRVSIEKSLPLLAEIWAKCSTELRSRSIDARLIIVGDGPYRARMASELADSNVHFLGFRYGEELSTLYASSDFFVFPSQTDTLGQVVMEAQASGLPALVTDVGGPKETVVHDRTGFVLPSADINVWVKHILQLSGDRSLRLRLGDAANIRMQGFSIRDSFEHFWAVHTQSELSFRKQRQTPPILTEPKPLAMVDTAVPEACTLPA